MEPVLPSEADEDALRGTAEASRLGNVWGRARPAGVGAAAEKAGGWANGRSLDPRALKSHAKDEGWGWPLGAAWEGRCRFDCGMTSCKLL